MVVDEQLCQRRVEVLASFFLDQGQRFLLWPGGFVAPRMCERVVDVDQADDSRLDRDSLSG